MTRRCSSSGRVKPSSGGALAGSRSWSAKTCGTYLRESITEADNCPAAVQFVAVALPLRSAAGPETRRGVQSEKFARREVNRLEAQTALTSYGGLADGRLPGAVRARQATAAKAYRCFLWSRSHTYFESPDWATNCPVPHRQQSQSSRILLVQSTSTQPCSQPCTTRTQPCKCPKEKLSLRAFSEANLLTLTMHLQICTKNISTRTFTLQLSCFVLFDQPGAC